MARRRRNPGSAILCQYGILYFSTSIAPLEAPHGPALPRPAVGQPLGAAIIAASSATAQAGPEAVALMRGNLLTATPSAWLSNDEIRYIFGAGNQAQSITLDLGREAAITAAGVSFQAGDRPLVGPLAVAGAPAAAPGAFALLAAAVPVSAARPDPVFNRVLEVGFGASVSVRYLRFLLGPTTTEYGSDGSGIGRLFVESAPVAIPEIKPAAWLGLAMIGLGLLRLRRRR